MLCMGKRLIREARGPEQETRRRPLQRTNARPEKELAAPARRFGQVQGCQFVMDAKPVDPCRGSLVPLFAAHRTL